MEMFCPGLEPYNHGIVSKGGKVSGVSVGSSLQASGFSISVLSCMLCQGYLEEELGLSQQPDRGVSVVERYT